MYVSFSLAISKVNGEDETFARLSTRTRRLKRRSARFVIDSFEIPRGINTLIEVNNGSTSMSVFHCNR